MDFGTYLRPNIALVTAITPEHMEFFGSIEHVAQEELFVAKFSEYTLINRDDIDGRFADFLESANFSTYGTTGLAEFRFEQQQLDENGYSGTVIAPNDIRFPATIKVVGEHSLRPIMGAVGAAMMLGLPVEDIIRGLSLLKPVPGRMNLLRGIGGGRRIAEPHAIGQSDDAVGVENRLMMDAAAHALPYERRPLRILPHTQGCSPLLR